MMLVKGQMRSIFQSFVMTLYAHWSSFSLDGWLMNGWMDERKIDRLGREPHLGGKHGDREMCGAGWMPVDIREDDRHDILDLRNAPWALTTRGSLTLSCFYRLSPTGGGEAGVPNPLSYTPSPFRESS